MELKIVCGCGAKYKFEVEPVNGQLPGPVHCPVCHADGTAEGNRLLAQMAAVPAPAESHGAPRISLPTAGAGGPRIAIPTIPKPAVAAPTTMAAASSAVPPTSARSGFSTPPIPRSSKEAAAAPPAAAASAPPIPVAMPAAPAPVASPLVPKPQAAGAPRLSVSKAHAEPAAAPAAAAPSEAAPPVPAPVASTPSLRAGPARSGTPGGYEGPNDFKGLIGAAIGGLVGMVLWYFLIVLTDRQWGYAAWGIGGLTGWCSKTIGKGESAAMGVAAAIAAAVSILGGNLLAAKHFANEAVDSYVKEAYQAHVTYAKEAVQAKTDEQIRTFLAKDQELEPGQAASITQEEIRDFKKELPKLQKAANGQVSQREYEKDFREMAETLFSFGFMLRQVLSISTIVFIGLGVFTAYKLAGP